MNNMKENLVKILHPEVHSRDLREAIDLVEGVELIEKNGSLFLRFDENAENYIKIKIKVIRSFYKKLSENRPPKLELKFYF